MTNDFPRPVDTDSHKGSPSSVADLERMVSDAERLLLTATTLAKTTQLMDSSTTVEISGRLSDAAFSCRVAGAVLKSRTTH